ncbi:MAG TPA: diiron oxygenase [Micromonosporaceae bacterium]|nr:diiron oxygenase [Micromonosporaceae bacterium]
MDRDLTQPDVLADLAGPWAARIGGTALFARDYDNHNEQMLRLYARGKQHQWDADARIDWSLDVDPDNPLGMSDAFVWIAGTPLWERLPERERIEIRRHTAGWTYSQLLHGEQLSLIGVAKMAQTLPRLDDKLFAATQVMDEARHTEAFNRYLATKIGVRYGMSSPLETLFAGILAESRWDFTALAVQVLVENLGLAAFGIQRDRTTEPLARTLNAYIMQDEARHVAFGRLLLRPFYRELSTVELEEREEFVVEACWALRDRFVGEEMWQALDYGAEECIRLARGSPAQREFRRRLFMRVVPALEDIGLFGPTVRDGLAKMGVLGFHGIDDDATRATDDRIADELDRREAAVRRQEIEATAEAGRSQQ